MTGRASLILILGFSLLMGYALQNLNTAGTLAAGNASTYNEMTASHNIALAGANVGLAKLYRDTTWGSASTVSMTQSFTGVPFAGSFTVSAFKAGAWKTLRSISSYPVAGDTYHDTIEVSLSNNIVNTFTLFAWMTNLENGVFWITGDEVWGRVHSNDNLTVSGSPIFHAKVTTAKNFIPPVGKTAKIGGKNYTNKAIFMNPPKPETGVPKINLPTDLTDLATAAASANGKKYTGDIWVTLDGKDPNTNGDGMAYIRQTKTGPIKDSIRLADPNFNGVLMATGVVNVSGKLDGDLTIASYSTPTATGNNVVIQGDILYEKNPLSYPTSDDRLGLVANNNVIVADNVPAGGDREIDGSIFARLGSFTAENYDTRPIQNQLKVLGSIVQNSRGAVGTFNGAATLQSGFYKSYRYDDRLADPTFRPPHYPGWVSTTYAILNWWESYKVMNYQ